MSKIKVLIVDDSAFMRSMLKRMVEKDDRFEVVGVAVDGKDGVEKATFLKPDVITMDIEMPVMTGLDALQKIMETVKIPVVMISTLTEAGAKVTLEALEKGAVDFIPKSLQDKDKNIFSSGNIIHEKLAAAAQAKPAAAFSSSATPAPIEPLATLAPTAVGSAKIMVIGSSTGGPKALHEVIKGLPANLQVPIVIAQHMPANFTKALADRLNDTCQISVKEMQNGETLKVGTVYIAPGGMHARVGMVGGVPTIKVEEDKGESFYKPSVDVLANSVFKAYANKVIAVMLTGMGNDGADAFAELKAAGAHVIAQNEATSTVYGMPRAVVEKGAATEVLSLAQIAPRLTQLFK